MKPYRGNGPDCAPGSGTAGADGEIPSPGDAALAAACRAALEHDRRAGGPVTHSLSPWVLVLLLMFPLMGFATGVSHQQNNAEAPLPVTAGRRILIQSLAAQALLKVTRAQRQIKQHHDDAAIETLRETQTLFDVMRAVHPAGRVKALIRYLKAVLNEGDNRQSLPDLLPLYAALDAMHESPAVRAARRHLDAAKRALEKPDVQSAEQQLDAASRALDIDGIDFPLEAARENLRLVLHDLLHQRAVGSSRLLSMKQDLLLIAGGSDGDTRN